MPEAEPVTTAVRQVKTKSSCRTTRQGAEAALSDWGGSAVDPLVGSLVVVLEVNEAPDTADEGGHDVVTRAESPLRRHDAALKGLVLHPLGADRERSGAGLAGLHQELVPCDGEMAVQEGESESVHSVVSGEYFTKVVEARPVGLAERFYVGEILKVRHR
jgi:hypothetical protein